MVTAGFSPGHRSFLSRFRRCCVRIVSILIVLPLAIVIVAFAVANRQAVTVSFDPLFRDQPCLRRDGPLFVMIFVLLILGVVVGGVAAWIRTGEVEADGAPA